MSDTDILIAGAGCAGLSLAVHLVEAGFTEYSITLVEPRTSYHRDRTWCFWDTEDHPFSRSISHSWSRWKVSSSEEILRGSTAYSYQHLSADDFYNDALEGLRNAPNVRLLQGHEIVSMHEDAQSVSVATTSGTFRARWVFDSRPPEWSLHPGPSPHSLPDDVCLFQHFVGVHLVFDEPVVSAESIDLMDFRVSQEHGPRFVYVLPFNNREVLVENTYVSSTTLPENLHHKQLSQYIKQRWGHASYKVRHIEMGVLPMQTAPFSSDPSSRIVPIGLRGGLSKPSTGYAFLAIQRHSSQIAQRFVSEQNPAACEVRSRWNVFVFPVLNF